MNTFPKVSVVTTTYNDIENLKRILAEVKKQTYPNIEHIIVAVSYTHLAGAAGVLYAHNLSTLTALPKNFGYNMSITILVFVVLGGIGNIRGSVIAAVVLTLLPELLRFLSDYRMLIYAVVLIVTMILVWSPGGIAFRERLENMNPFCKKEKEVQ